MLHQSAPSCTKVHQVAPICTKLHQSGPHWTNPHQTSSSFTRMQHVAPICCKLHQSALSCTKLHQVPTDCIKCHQIAPCCKKGGWEATHDFYLMPKCCLLDYALEENVLTDQMWFLPLISIWEVITHILIFPSHCFWSAWFALWGESIFSLTSFKM